MVAGALVLVVCLLPVGTEAGSKFTVIAVSLFSLVLLFLNSFPGLCPRLLAAAAAAAGSVVCTLEVVADSAGGLPEDLPVLETPAAPRPRPCTQAGSFCKRAERREVGKKKNQQVSLQ